jgi:hypothetical protein
MSIPSTQPLELGATPNPSDRTIPTLWIDSTVEEYIRTRYSSDFQICTLADEPQPGYHVIALQGERNVRKLLYKLEQFKNPDVRIFPAELLPFEIPMNILLKGQYVELWLAAAKEELLELTDALDMAEDILNSSLPSKRRNIELEQLRRRCEVSSFDWNKFISDLEREIHAAVDGKTSDPDERLRLDLKALLKETDPIKRMRRRAEIASHYRIKTSDIEQALKHIDERSNLKEPRLMGLDELFSLPQSAIDYVIPGMLPAGETVILAASPKAGKSLVAYDAAFAVATGEDFFLGESVKQGKVLLIQCDESSNTARGRLIKRGFRPEDAPNVKFIDSFKITQLDLLEEWLESFRPTLVVIDCLRKINTGRVVSENSAEFADSVYQVKELITRYNAACILIHHTNKNQEAVGVERVRGSSAIAGAVWGVWQLDHILKPDPNNKRRMIVDPKDPTRILSVIARDVEGQRLRIELDPENNRWINLGEDGVGASDLTDRKTNEDKIVQLLKPIAPTGLESSELNEHLNLGRSIYSHLNRLLSKGIIGSRPSTTDRRRTVYYYPKNDDGDTPPSLPPAPTDQNVIEYAETLTTQALENRSQIDHKSITKKTPKKPVNASKPEQASAPEVDHKNRSQGGERGPAATDSPLAKGQWRMVCTNTGLREGKLIECLGDSWRVKVGMNNLVIPTSHIHSLTS